MSSSSLPGVQGVVTVTLPGPTWGLGLAHPSAHTACGLLYLGLSGTLYPMREKALLLKGLEVSRLHEVIASSRSLSPCLMSLRVLLSGPLPPAFLGARRGSHPARQMQSPGRSCCLSGSLRTHSHSAWLPSCVLSAFLPALLRSNIDFQLQSG